MPSQRPSHTLTNLLTISSLLSMIAVLGIETLLRLIRGDLLSSGDFFTIFSDSIPFWIFTVFFLGLTLSRWLPPLLNFFAKIFSKPAHITPAQRQQIEQKYQLASSLIGQGGSANLRSAIIMLDNLLDFALSCYGLPGSLGEKLKQSGHLFSDLDSVWQAHKYRNRLVHELDFNPRRQDATRVSRFFYQALRDLKAL